ncbi:hypothetical protein SANTM175S_09819 [Streptomyces antimycoticus]
MSGGQGLGPQNGCSRPGSSSADLAGVRRAGGVEDGGEGVFGGDGVDEVPECGAVGGVAGGDGDVRPQGGEFLGEFGRAGRVGAGAADEVEVGRAVVGEPAGDMGAETPGAAGDERGTRGLPGRWGRCRGGHRVGGGGRSSGGADGGLILGLPGDEQGGQPGRGVVGHGGGEVDEAAPAVRVFQRGGAAEPPDLRLLGVGEEVAATGGDGALRHAPQGRADVGITESLEKSDGGAEPGRAPRSSR